MGPVPNCAHCGAVVDQGARQCLGCGVTLSGREHTTLPGPGYAGAPPASDPMIGRSIIGQFVVKDKLGMGGMGGVYLADQTTVERTAVIKVIHPWLSRDRGIAARFAAEARAAARLQNPHIVSIYNYGKLPDGTLFLAMEHLRGSTLAEVLRKQGRLEPSRVVHIATQCCEALSEAHRHGVVHRDVKPSNIMLLDRYQGPGFVKMVDFGVATIDDRDAAPGRFPAGTPCYMSPEQLGEGTVDGRSDIYSLAVVIYEMLTGWPPFTAHNPEEYARLHRDVPPPSPAEIAPDVQLPPALEACVMRALAKQPHARPQAADLFADELRNAVASTATIAVHVPSGSARARRPLAAGPFLGAIAVGMLLMAGIGAAAYAWLDREPSERPATSSAAPPVALTAPKDVPEPVKRALMQHSVVELQIELDRVAALSGRDAREVAGAIAAYRDSTRQTPAGRNPEVHRRVVLAGLILRWAQDPVPPKQPVSLAELEAIFLRMNSPVEVEERRQMLHSLKSRDDATAATVRAQLLGWIDQHGLSYETGDPGAELVLDDEP